MTTDSGYTTFQPPQKPSNTQLAAIVVDEGDRFKLSHADKVPTALPTSEETEKIARHLEKDFTGLQFSSAVNLADSKQAFQTLTSGLDDSQDFMSLFGLRPHDPHTYSSPMDDIDPSLLTETDRDLMVSTKKEVIDPKRP